MRFAIKPREADEFVGCLGETIVTSSNVRPYNPRRDALVLSFDNEFRPFLNYTKGYHSARDRRLYLKNVPELVRQIGERVAPYRRPGGRVFINGEKAYFDDESLGEIDLCELSWPVNRDVVAEIRSFVSASRRRATITLTNVTWS